MFKKDGFHLDIEPVQTPRRVCKLLFQSRRLSREERQTDRQRTDKQRERESAAGLDTRQGERRGASPGRRGSQVRPRRHLSPPFVLRTGPLAAASLGTRLLSEAEANPPARGAPMCAEWILEVWVPDKRGPRGPAVTARRKRTVPASESAVRAGCGIHRRRSATQTDDTHHMVCLRNGAA